MARPTLESPLVDRPGPIGLKTERVSDFPATGSAVGAEEAKAGRKNNLSNYLAGRMV